MDRFRDRFTMAGAKDDSRDAEVMASALRTDPRCFRPLAAADPIIVELREWSRIAEDLGVERNRLVNRLREQLWRYFPALLELEDDLGAEWLLELWEAAPTPDTASRLREATIAKLLKRHRIRRFDAAFVVNTLRRPPVRVAAGTVEAASAHVALLVPRIRLLNRQIKDAHSRIDGLTARLMPAEEAEPGQKKQHDAELSRGDLPSPSPSVSLTGLQHRSPTPSTIGRGSPCSTIRAAERNTPNSDAEVTATAERCGRSPTALSTSPAPCSNPAPPSTRPQPLKNPLDKRWGVPSPPSISSFIAKGIPDRGFLIS